VASKKAKRSPSREREGDTESGASDAPGAFEQSIRRLGEIVDTLEDGDLPLEESLKLFEEGIKLARRSQAVLDRAEKRVEELLSVDDEGNPITREIDLEDDD